MAEPYIATRCNYVSNIIYSITNRKINLVMIQIIGKGGFGREVEAYCFEHNIEANSFENECQYMRRHQDAVIAIGNEEVRSKVVEEFPGQSWGILNFGKSYHGCICEQGTIICPNTILTVNVRIGKHCIVNINCTIGHDVVIGDFVTINPGVNISGKVRVGGNCNIGSNAVIRNGVSICDDVVIGAGGVVVKDITEPGVYIGNPAVRMDKRPKYVTKKEVEEIISNLPVIENLVKTTNELVRDTSSVFHKQLTPPPKPEKVEKKKG